ncbi:Zn-dependent protease with chaperone function [Oxalobacteraceae bacterium GrIS 1.11]
MIDAIYFDGQSTRRQAVTMIIHKRVVSIRGVGVHRSVRMSKLDISERLQHAPRIMRFPDGAFLEVGDPRLQKMLRENRYIEPRVVRWQNNWVLSLFALITLLAVLISGYQWGLPWAADGIAQHLPTSIEKKIGNQELAMIDGRFLKPSTLAPAEQARLQSLFAALRQPNGDKTAYQLQFRDSGIGPNAFALPNGVIVMTDQLVQLAGNDQAIMGVLSHELGHVRGRHSLRHIMRALGVGIVLNLWVGDVSSTLAALPTFLLDQKYSRDFERDADRYAIDMMHANHAPLAPMADMFEKMTAQRVMAQAEAGAEPADGQAGPTAGQKRKAAPDFLSSHPSDGERIATLRAADGQ